MRPRGESPALLLEDRLLAPLLYADTVGAKADRLPLLRCPHCGGTNVYPIRTEVALGDNYQTIEVVVVTSDGSIFPLEPEAAFVDRRHANRGAVFGVVLYCEADHVSVVQIAVHKGRSYADTRSWPGPFPTVGP